MLGFPEFVRARPNAAHHALADLERGGFVRAVITQNVDDLHQRAGQRTVEALHGRLHRVRCLDCGASSSRVDLQGRLEADNAAFRNLRAIAGADGDADIEDADLSNFCVPDCLVCGGMLKPDVVFFGDSVPATRVSRCRALIADASGVLVVGSSLMVYSGFRFIRQAVAGDVPVALVNRGLSRADDLLSLKLDADCTVALPALASALLGNVVQRPDSDAT